MKNSSKIAVNTGILYVKMIVSTVFALMSTRWLLEGLGAEDFGIFNLVAGLVSMFAFLNTAMASASQRYLSFAIGTKDKELLRITFYYSIIQHIVIGIAVFALFEVGGLFFLDDVLDIPTGRKPEAQFVLQCLSISTFLTIITVPYQAIANSHENMLLIAMIGILESGLKFAAALYLLYFSGNRLKLYAVCIVAISLISMTVVRAYCKRCYPESHFKFRKISDRVLFKEFGLFAFWNFFGALAGVIKNQGMAMILNVYYGVIVNAAYGIANQVNGQMQYFAGTMVRSINPKLVQSEGAGDTKKMLEYSMMACKIPSLLLSLLVIPLIIKMSFVLHLWLGNYPEYTMSFCQIVLIASLIYQSTRGIELSIHAKGNIKMFQIVGYGLQLGIFPIGLLLLHLGASPSCVLSLLIFANICNAVAVMYYSHKYAELNVRWYIWKFFLPFYLILALSVFICFTIEHSTNCEFLNFCLIFFVNALLISLLSWALLLGNAEKKFIKQLMGKVKDKFIMAGKGKGNNKGDDNTSELQKK